MDKGRGGEGRENGNRKGEMENGNGKGGMENGSGKGDGGGKKVGKEEEKNTLLTYTHMMINNFIRFLYTGLD